MLPNRARGASGDEDDSRFVARPVSGWRLGTVDMPQQHHAWYANRSEDLDATDVIVIDVDLNSAGRPPQAQPIGPQRLDRLVRRVEDTLVDFLGRERVVIRRRRDGGIRAPTAGS